MIAQKAALLALERQAEGRSIRVVRIGVVEREDRLVTAQSGDHADLLFIEQDFKGVGGHR
jgi:hypothetical protein